MIKTKNDLDSRLISEIQADGTPIREYVYLQNEPLAVREYQKSPGLYFFLNDHLGTPQKLIDTAGAVVWAAAYLPYGEAQVQPNNTITNNLRFPGQYYDEETDLHYNWNRYYDPVLGRYLSPDPIGLEGGMNLYGYVGGDPVNWVDPDGLLTESEVRELVEANNKSNLSTELILCIIYKESSFNPNVKNDKSTANGLMGVTNPSAIWVGYSAKNMYNPASNIQAGTKILNRFTNWKNLGNGNIDKGLFMYGTGDNETPEYSKQILDCEKCLRIKSEGNCNDSDDCYKKIHK